MIEACVSTCLCNTHSLYWIDCDLWYVIRFAYITVVLVSQRERSVCWVKSMRFKVMDVVLLICGEAGQQGYGVSRFKYVRSAGLLTWLLWHSLMVSLHCNLYGLSSVSVQSNGGSQ